MNRLPADKLPAKLKVAMIILVCSCLFSTARIIRYAPKPWNLAPDNIAQRSDQRFAAVKQALPSRGVIGYVGETGESALPDYYLTQYALAPLVVDRSVNHDLVLENFTGKQIPGSLAGLQEIQEFGKGIILLRNEDAR